MLIILNFSGPNISIFCYSNVVFVKPDSYLLLTQDAFDCQELNDIICFYLILLIPIIVLLMIWCKLNWKFIPKNWTDTKWYIKIIWLNKQHALCFIPVLYPFILLGLGQLNYSIDINLNMDIYHNKMKNGLDWLSQCGLAFVESHYILNDSIYNDTEVNQLTNNLWTKLTTYAMENQPGTSKQNWVYDGTILPDTVEQLNTKNTFTYLNKEKPVINTSCSLWFDARFKYCQIILDPNNTFIKIYKFQNVELTVPTSAFMKDPVGTLNTAIYNESITKDRSFLAGHPTGPDFYRGLLNYCNKDFIKITAAYNLLDNPLTVDAKQPLDVRDYSHPNLRHLLGAECYALHEPNWHLLWRGIEFGSGARGNWYEMKTDIGKILVKDGKVDILLDCLNKGNRNSRSFTVSVDEFTKNPVQALHDWIDNVVNTKSQKVLPKNQYYPFHTLVECLQDKLINSGKAVTYLVNPEKIPYLKTTQTAIDSQAMLDSTLGSSTAVNPEPSKPLDPEAEADQYINYD